VIDPLDRYWLKLLDGLVVTIELVVISVVLGALLAIPIAAARLSRNRFISGIAFGYVYFFRGTPVLAQLFLIYYGAGQFNDALKSVGLWDFLREPFFCAILAFVLNTAAYQAEIYRGAIRSVPKGQWEAARALGMHRMPILRKVILPQAAVVALRPLGNEIILMIKASAVASIVTVLDLMGQTRWAFSRSYNMMIYVYAAVLYLAMVEIIRRLWNLLERRMTRHLLPDARMRTADLVPAAR
jgi:polar amino acid transport system permease protein